MKYYLDITLLPDAETNLGFLWHKVYQQIHIMLVEHKISDKDSEIALSFPKYRHLGSSDKGSKVFPLGNKLRMFAQTYEKLDGLKIAQWLNRLDDYVHIKAIKEVPNDVIEYAYFKRKNFKSPAKLMKEIDSRAAKIAAKNGFDLVKVKERLMVSIAKLEERSTLPYINLRSLSSDKLLSAEDRKKFLLFIECEIVTQPLNQIGLFTCHGLSRRSEEEQSAVPWFEG
ncbi:type I-F CRISPR-associated endoribonuclease Cas6/Csy4 [Pseudoalteromonas sp. MMG005]|uniref:type I-F CRISPR-associated endoribonuclease Cas6/Csy4 n=1 Tax=Pseudoalteromonas sp. MMG005 TaxID=2822682 RepID=UPI001B39D821|nr:type I-F CRISPR-associated endoribonuclease Cas6/Csy4 [Pseudoalteromonas sp. MMG005]MBQ4845248.1 type I-F CRISPR-associated endoribonuclease Cas6/Csy4 [Pseudoalteromonas sp. MMG005]